MLSVFFSFVKFSYLIDHSAAGLFYQQRPLQSRAVAVAPALTPTLSLPLTLSLALALTPALAQDRGRSLTDSGLGHVFDSPSSKCRNALNGFPFQIESLRFPAQMKRQNSHFVKTVQSA